MLQVGGLQGLVNDLERIRREGPERVEEGIKTVAEQVLSAAKARVPVDTGELRDSGHLVESAGQVQVVFDAPHASVVHEVMRPHRSGEPKFLERAASEADLSPIDKAVDKAL